MLVLKGHVSRQTVYSVAFAPDGAALASCSLDGTVRLWDSRAGTHRVVGKTYGYLTRSVAFSPDGKKVAWVDREQLRLYDVATSDCPSLPIEGRDSHAWPKVRFAPDGSSVATAGINVLLWEMPSGRLQRVWGDGTVSSCLAFVPVNSCLAFVPDRQAIAVGHTHWNSRTGRYRHEVALYDLPTRKVQTILPAKRQVKDLAFASNGRTLAAACEEYLTVWDISVEEPIFQHKSDNRHFQGIAFTPDGRLLAATHNDRTVRMWDTRDWGERAAFDWGIGEVTCIAFAPDGLRAAAGGRTGRIVVWDVDL